MMKYAHDLELGARLSERELRELIWERRNDRLLLGLMHYLRDEAALAGVESVEARREQLAAAADLAQGGQDRVVQVLMKWEMMRAPGGGRMDGGEEKGEEEEESELEP